MVRLERIFRSFRQLLSILLSLLIAAEVLPLSAFAAEAQNETDTASTPKIADSAFILVNSDVQISDDYLPETTYISEIDAFEYELELEERDYPEGFVLSKTVGDPMVYLTQRWLNQEYGNVPGFGSVPENGQTGWDTIYGLLRAMQHELGITSLSNNFGPTTTSLYSKNLLYRQDGVTNRMFAILQGALWCKGYFPGYYLRENADGTVSFSEVFNENVERAVIELKQDAGFINPDGVVTVNVMKALMSMDSFKLLTYYGGDPKVREMQQKLNRKYEAYTGLTPCDGVYGRNTNKALIYALQCEEGLPINVANGNFGVTTKLCCPQIPYIRNSWAARRYPGTTAGSYYSNTQITALTELLQFALYVNGFGDGVTDGVWDADIQQAIRDFQKKYAISQTGIADTATWLSLFISCGDTDRSALAADCATILTAEKAKTLYENGYRFIGRYLTGTLSGGISKAITREEAQIIFDAGLRFFPIFQTSAYYNSYFTAEQGVADAEAAIKAAIKLGLPDYTIIYFAVDYDCMDYQITSNVIPYFKSVSEEMAGSNYRVGIYGTRNTCTRVSDLGYACSSFVGDMSTGFSGNLGFSMPDNWAFDQFKTITLGSGNGQIEIDKDGYSGRDPAVKELKDPVVSIPEIYFGSSASDIMQGPTVNLLGYDVPLFTLDVGFNFPDLLELDTTYDAKENEFKVLIGYNIESMTSEITGGKEKVGKFNQAYIEVKTTLSSLGKNEQTFTNKFRDMKGSLYQKGVKVGLESTGYIFGFITIDCDTGYVKEGGMAIVAEVEYSIKYPIVPLIYAKFAIEGSIESGVHLVYDTISNSITPSGEILFTVSPKFSVGVDIIAANAYAGIMGTMNCAVKYPGKSLEDMFEATLSASVFFEYQALLWGNNYEWEFKNFRLYPQLDTESAMSIDFDDLQLIEPLSQSFSTFSINNNNVLSSNMQIYCNPQIISLGNGKMLMTYIADATNRTAANRTVLMYSVYDEVTWSVPEPVLDDSTADFEPAIYADGNGGAHIVWQNSSSVFSSDVTLEEMTSEIELYYAHWNGSSFDNTTAITDNSDYEMAPKVVASGDDITILWQQNSENAAFVLDGTNSIHRRQCSAGQWQDIETIADSLSVITSIDTAYVGNNNVIAYTASTNADIGSIEVFYFNGSDTVRITNDSVPDYAICLLGADLYWISDNSIISVTNGDTTQKTVIVSNINPTASNIKVLESEDSVGAVIWQQESYSGEGFYGIYYNKVSNSFGSVIPLSDDSGVIRGWDACMLPNGQIELIYCFAEKLSEPINGKPYAQLDLMQKSAIEFCDIYVAPMVTYSGNIEIGQRIDLVANVYNSGSLAINQFTVNVINSSNDVVQSSIIDCALNVGDSTELVIPFTLPIDTVKTDYTISVYPTNQTDINMSDNKATVTIGDADIVIERVQENRTEAGRELIVTMKNQGLCPINSASLRFFKDSANGTLLNTVSISELLQGEEISCTFIVPEDELDSSVSEKPRSYYFLAETDELEADYGNNDKLIYVYPDFTINLIAGNGGVVTGTGTYKKETIVSLLATPNPGYIFDGWYESDLRLYEIPEEYTVTVNANRTIEARFRENDLEITALEAFGLLELGKTIAFTATAEGGMLPRQWEFYIKKDNETVYSNDTATVNFFEWTPSESGIFDVLIYVTDVTGQKASYTTSVTII